MRIRLALVGALVVLATAFVVPVTASAASIDSSTGYSYKVIYNYCSGGAAYFKVKETAKGWTPADSLTIDAKAQELSGGRWRTTHYFPQHNYYFYANGNTHWLTAWENWGSYNYVRLVFNLRVWSNNGVLAQKTLRSQTC